MCIYESAVDATCSAVYIIMKIKKKKKEKTDHVH